ncbi:hypothetical protein [Hymenobacter cellulosilyticus]|uniref:Uncharacterized protein n=1 Tax=Hymenobacter cellulosilyticus TaxID=2932248 RepID=A0A8T9QBI8_9BACT|nr:hypothetical protein [Hymenobacter cellulosilyticus]UOQ73741.1 hypothetical protein MUN79_07430 [Hymenobacter cellulosilyticus]
MPRLFLCLPIILLYSLQTAAQSSGGSNASVAPAAPSDEVTSFRTGKRSSDGPSVPQYQWDVSVDASFILPRFTSPILYSPSTYASPLNAYSPYDLGRSTTFMLRKNEIVRNATNIPVRRGAYRLNLNWAIDLGKISEDSIRVNYVSSTGQIVEKKANYAAVGVAAGYEWQKPLGRFQIFYGYDVFAGYATDSRTGVLFFEATDPITNQRLKQQKDVKLVYRRTDLGISPWWGQNTFLRPGFPSLLKARCMYAITGILSRKIIPLYRCSAPAKAKALLRA